MYKISPSTLKWGLFGLLPDALIQTTIPSEGQKRLLLTFDDGPDPDHTPELLELLDEYNAIAEFYLIGRKIEKNRHVVESISGRGHVLGNHSWNHDSFAGQSLEGKMQDIRRTDALLGEIDGKEKHPFRPPRGIINFSLFAGLVRNGYRTVMWSRDSCDYKYKTGDRVIASLRSPSVKAGDILLFHDDTRICIDALRELLPMWRDQGFVFDSLKT